MEQELTLQSSLLKKYLIKRQRKREEPTPSHSNIFSLCPEDDQMLDSERYPFAKYQTLSTNADQSQVPRFSTVDATCQPVSSFREDCRGRLPQISMRLKLGKEDISLTKLTGSTPLAFPPKHKELVRHVSDPLHLQMENSNWKRQQLKHFKYRKGWTEMSRQRKGKSLVERSFDKSVDLIKAKNAEVERRRKYPVLEEQLRNCIAEKAFAEPGTLRSDIEGLRGKGGQFIPLFCEVRVAE